MPGMSERTIISDGFSKSYAMTGWRLGFGVFPPELVGAVLQLQKNSVSAAAAFTQRAGHRRPGGPAGRGRRDGGRVPPPARRARRGLRQIPGVETVTPDGALYTFPASPRRA